MSISESQTQDCIAVDQDADHDELVTAVLKLAEENRQLRTRFGELEDNHADLRDDHADLRDDHADLREEHADLKQEHAKQAARLDTLEQQNTDQAARIDDLEQQLQQEQDLRGQQVAETRQTISQLHDTVDQLHDTLDQLQQHSESTPTQTEHPPQSHSLTPIEQLSHGDRQDVAANVTPSVQRALALFEHLPEWGTSTPKGITLDSDDRPKDLLEAATGESLAWQQYYRACEALESLSKGAVTFIDHRRHGKTLVFHDDTDVHTRATTSNHGDSRPSLVAD